MENNKLDNKIIVFLLLIFMTEHSFVIVAFELLLYLFFINKYFINVKINKMTQELITEKLNELIHYPDRKQANLLSLLQMQ